MTPQASQDFASTPAPAAFVSHGSPLLALDHGEYTGALRAFFEEARPRAVVVVSAHWETPAPRVTGSAHPPLVYDFGGFPGELYALKYPVPGSPELAQAIVQRLADAGLPASVELVRGLDHGAWVPLRLGLPEARVPVLQLSLPRGAQPKELLALGRALAPLRNEGVVLLGSGGLVHNLGRIDWQEWGQAPEAWASDFDAWVAQRIQAMDIEALVTYRTAAPHARLAVPTTEHFDPLFFVLGASLPGDTVAPVFEGFQHQNLSLRSFALRASSRSSNPGVHTHAS